MGKNVYLPSQMFSFSFTVTEEDVNKVFTFRKLQTLVPHVPAASIGIDITWRLRASNTTLLMWMKTNVCVTEQ